jgi:uncharacterized protein YndB with AHSA1/START domain
MDRTLQQETLLLTRFYAVEPEKVWRAWTEPEALRIWFGQVDATDWKAQLDVRVGGRYHLVMREPSGRYYSVRGVYREVTPHERLAFTWEQRDSPFDGDSLVTVEFQAVNNGTQFRFELAPVIDPRAPDAWRGDFKRLGRLLQPYD